MGEFTTNWTDKEFEAYLLLFAASADFQESDNEIEVIKSHIHSNDMKAIHDEFDGDNDYQRIQKIQDTVSRFGFSKDEVEILFSEMIEVFKADGKFDILEENLLRGLRKVLQ